jgi:hypothetical protein
MYAFDQYQYNEPNHFIYDVEKIFNAPDYSLRAVFHHIFAADIPAYDNFRTNIYFPALDTVFFSNTSAANSTELEKVVIMPNEMLERSSIKTARIRSNKEGFRDVRLSEKVYYKYISFLIYN